MPITVTAPRGVLTPDGERAVLPRLTRALAAASGAPDEPSLLASIGGTVHVLDPDRVYAGGVNRPLVLVEVRLPGAGLPTPEARAAFIRAATDAVLDLASPGHEPGDVWVNVVNAPDGGWGVGGRAFADDELRDQARRWAR